MKASASSGRNGWRAMSWPARLMSLPVYFYRWVLSPLLPRNCRFEPSCSSYALEALSRHGALTGSWLTLRRVARCHPLGGSGFDPVPERPSVRRPGLRGLAEVSRDPVAPAGDHRLNEGGDHG